MRTYTSLTMALLATLLFILSGCSATMPKHAAGPAFTPAKAPRGSAIIYLYRPERFSMSATTNFMSIPLEADNCYAMVNGGYYAYIVKPGKVNIGAVALNSGLQKYSTAVKAGEVKYVDVSFNSMYPKPEFKEVSADVGLAAMKTLHQISACKK